MATTRDIAIDVEQQTAKAFALEFIGDTLGADGEVFLETIYRFTINADGTVGDTNDVVLVLPVPTTGSRRYRVKLPKDSFESKGLVDIRKFYLTAGAEISLSELLAEGGLAPTGDTAIAYFQGLIAAHAAQRANPGLASHARFNPDDFDNDNGLISLAAGAGGGGGSSTIPFTDYAGAASNITLSGSFIPFTSYAGSASNIQL